MKNGQRLNIAPGRRASPRHPVGICRAFSCFIPWASVSVPAAAGRERSEFLRTVTTKDGMHQYPVSALAGILDGPPWTSGTPNPNARAKSWSLLVTSRLRQHVMLEAPGSRSLWNVVRKEVSGSLMASHTLLRRRGRTFPSLHVNGVHGLQFPFFDGRLAREST